MKSKTRRFAIADNNLIISAFIRPEGTAYRALRKLASEFELLGSEVTLRELRITLSRRKFERWVGQERRSELFSLYAAGLTIVEVTHHVLDCRDPRDNMFLELALSGQADIVVTGDDDLLCLHPWRGVAVLSPADYLALAQ